MRCPNCDLIRGFSGWLTDQLIKIGLSRYWIYRCPRCICKFYCYNHVTEACQIYTNGMNPNKLVEQDDFFYACNEKVPKL
jgi:hypothetical protein